MRLSFFLSLFFVLCAGPSLVAEEPRSEPFFAYSWSGGLSSYNKISVQISNAGKAVVQMERFKGPVSSYQTELSGDEMEALRTLIASTQFFSLPDKPDTSEPEPTDVGATEITIRSTDKSKSFAFGYLPALDPLTQFVGKLIAQASAMTAIESDGDIYTAKGAVNPQHGGVKVLQPDRLKAAFSKYVTKSTHPQKITWSLEALAWITTPETFAGFVATEIGKPKRRDLILLALPEYGNVPGEHWKALCPLYLDFIQKNHSRAGELTPAEKGAYEVFVRWLGDAKYEPGIPLFLSWFEQLDQVGITMDTAPLGKMGMPALRALIPYLDSPEELRRGNAIELLTLTSRGGPRSQYSNFFSDVEYAEMIPVFRDTVLPKLAILSESDPSAEVRKLASAAIPEIRSEIAK